MNERMKGRSIGEIEMIVSNEGEKDEGVMN